MISKLELEALVSRIEEKKIVEKKYHIFDEQANYDESYNDGLSEAVSIIRESIKK